MTEEMRQQFAAWGRKGGKSRAKKLTKRELSEIGRKGGKAPRKRKARK